MKRWVLAALLACDSGEDEAAEAAAPVCDDAPALDCDCAAPGTPKDEACCDAVARLRCLAADAARGCTADADCAGVETLARWDCFAYPFGTDDPGFAEASMLGSFIAGECTGEAVCVHIDCSAGVPVPACVEGRCAMVEAPDGGAS